MISTQDLLNICVAVGFVILVGFVSYAAFQIAQTVKTVRRVVDHIELTTDSLKLGALGIARNILGGLNGRR